MKRILKARHSIYAMARIGYIDPQTEARIYTDDPGKIPHMHIKGEDLDCCVRLGKPDYFPHGHHRSKLNSRQIRQLVQFLKSTNTVTKTSNWETAIMFWNMNNSDVIVDETEKMPDYLHSL